MKDPTYPKLSKHQNC